MKKLISTFEIIAAAAIAFTACQQELPVAEQPVPQLATITFTAQAPATKLAVTEGQSSASYTWTDEDVSNLRLYTVVTDNEGKETLTRVTDVTPVKDSDTQMTISATVAKGTYTFRAVISGTWTGKGKPRLNNSQSPSASAFDPNACVLVSEDKEITITGGDTAAEEFDLPFERFSVVSKMTLKGLDAAEAVKKVVISSDKSITGYVDDGKVIKNDNKTITLTYAGTQNVSSAGTWDVYFTTLPSQENTLTVEVTTDKNTYSKTFGSAGINFEQGKFTRFGVNLPAGTPISTGSELADGKYALVGIHESDYFAARAFVSSNNNLRSAALTLGSNNYTCTSDDILFTFTKVTTGDFKGYYTIQDANDAYLYAASSGSNYMKANATLGESEYYWSVEEDGAGAYSIIAQNSSMRNNMRFNYNSGSPLFSCYAASSSTGINIMLIPEDDIEFATIPGPTELTTVTAETTWGSTVFQAGINKYGTGDMTSDFIFENLGFVAGGGKFKFGSDSSTPRIQLGGTGTPGTKASIQIKVGGSGTLTLKARASGSATDRPLMVAVGSTPVDNGNIVPTNTADIEAFSYSVSASDGDLVNIYSGKSGINIYEIKWTPGGSVTPGPTADFTTIAELNALATTTATDYTGTLTNAVVSFVPSTNNAFIKDATGTVLLYKSNHGLKQGQTFSGETTVKLTVYNGCSEITAIDATFTGAESNVAPETVALSSLVGNFAVYQNAYVKVEDLTVSSVDGKNIYVTDGTNSYVVYDNTGNASCSAGDVISAIGTITKYNTTEEIKVWAASDITVQSGNTGGNTGGDTGGGSSSKSVVYDFTGTDWTVSNNTLSNGTVSFTGAGEANFKMNSGYFMMGKSGAYLTFPKYSDPVQKIIVTGRGGASGSVVQNIYVEDTAVSTATTGATGTNTYVINSSYQAAGTIYILKVTSSHNTQITKIEVVFVE